MLPSFFKIHFLIGISNTGMETISPALHDGYAERDTQLSVLYEVLFLHLF